MRLHASFVVACALSLGTGCNSSPLATVLVCGTIANGCECDMEPTQVASSSTLDACGPDEVPGGTCCADPSWPSSGTCECVTASGDEGGTTSEGGATTSPTCSGSRTPVAQCH